MIRSGRSPIIVGMDATPADAYNALCDEIQTLLERPASGPEQSLERLEDTLTEGYARALALEAERLRLERHIGERGGDVRRGESPGDDIPTLAARLSHTTSQLANLRTLLTGLRARTDVVRTRGVYAATENRAG
jgi:hypothetical protein